MNFKELEQQINENPQANGWNLLAVSSAFDEKRITPEQKAILIGLIEGKTELKEYPVHIDEKKLSGLLNSEQFIGLLLRFSPECREKVLEYSIYYLTVQRDGYGFLGFVESLHRIENDMKNWKETLFHRVFPIIIESIARRLNITMPLNEESESLIFDFFNKVRGEHEIYFHSFNGCFEESIRKHGLDPDIRFWDWNELDNINRIFKSHGEGMIIGWADLNCKKKTSISGYPFYRFAFARIGHPVDVNPIR